MDQLDLFAAPAEPDGRPPGYDARHYAYWCPHCDAQPGELCRSKGNLKNVQDPDGDRIDKTLWVHGVRGQRRMGAYDPPKPWPTWRAIEDACDDLEAACLTGP